MGKAFIRPTTLEDLPQLIQIYDIARRFMQQIGNAGQWTKGYPRKELLISDIEQRRSYVCTTPDGEILATFCYFIGEEPTYLNIYNGAWLNDAPYGVIHRIASSGKQKGVGEACINWCLEQSQNIRIDTHRDNKVMQHILKKLQFTYCGIIYLENGDERLAYQKTG